MRIAIREQLAALVLLAVLISLAIVSIPTWIYVNRFVVDIEREGLQLTASLKASRISAELDLVETIAMTISSRILVQTALTNHYDSTDAADWADAREDLASALSSSTTSGLLQIRLYSRNGTGAPGGVLLNVTSLSVPTITLPYKDSSGTDVVLGNSELGYPPSLFPNLTFVDLKRPNSLRNNTTAYAAEAFDDVRIARDGGLLLGPLVLNESASLLSVTIPVRDNNDTFILGYMSVVTLAQSLTAVQESREGLGETGSVLLIGPTDRSNRFNKTQPASNATYTPDRDKFGNVMVKFVLPPKSPEGQKDLHDVHQFISEYGNRAFPVKNYPAALDSFTKHYDTVNNASALLNTHNEQDARVAVGFARTQTPLANWTVIVEKAKWEAYKPINTLRNILLGTVFGTVGLIALIIIPCAHVSVLPIRKLKAATEKSINPPGYEDSFIDSDSDFGEDIPSSGGISRRSRKKGPIAKFIRRLQGKSNGPSSNRDVARRMFKIPAKVDDRRHFVTDELTELTRTFNDMSDELVKQYLSLEVKVAERTRELEESKKAAEAANESKTLFIANISHELKTPLNGILGMCAVCMEENDIVRIKQSLKTLYKSGDLLLHLLEDLLSFSKNQIGQQLNLELREFRLADIRSQILTIFDKQVREGKINFSVDFIGSENVATSRSPDRMNGETRLPALGPYGTGRLKDMCLWGDQHRILQVIINLVSNSLKFTPHNGSVSVRIKCLGEAETAIENDSRASSISKNSRNNSRTGRPRQRGSASSAHSGNSGRNSTQKFSGTGTALSINPMDPKATPHVQVRERSPTPPPPGAKSYLFEFEVQDTGPGIPDHMQQKVFEPFVQGDLGLSKKFGGTGLGLSICHQLAGLMGGHIKLRSSVGVGTTFTMQIPLKYVKDRTSSTASSSVKSRPTSVDASDLEPPRTAPNTPKPAAETKSAGALNPQPRLVGLSQPYFAADPPSVKSTQQKIAEIDRAVANKSGQRVRVLVADDNSTNIEVVSRMLKLEDVYDVTIAKDGQEAYDLVKATMEKNQSFDVIFMDVQMPNVDGLQSTRLIREMGYTSPIVALTAFSEESNVKECIDSGMDEFLAKPIRRPALKQVLKKFATIPEEPENEKRSSSLKPKMRVNGHAVHPHEAENGAPKEKHG
ncbi:osomolarity two-component system, sensor histidine kinase sln1 [Fusarium flagelliforme]|uniref:histidine kinase n=1 Tax=Fusarium flagelliforme TaxID=2675880 RepID=A0A395MUR1_9HYPO|nr:osomolarity two-component system, sensor histidine kinase sln1 [Fusarium flagelliforme]